MPPLVKPSKKTETLAAIAVVSLSTVIVVTWQMQRRKKRFHAPYKPPELPPVLSVLAWTLPKSIRRSIAIKNAVPKPPIDGLDCSGTDKHDPYVEKRELVPNMLYRVRYQFGIDPEFLSFWSLLGIDLCDPAMLDRVPKRLRDKVQESMESLAQLKKEIQGLDEQQARRMKILNAGFEDSQDTFVVRLKSTNGLLLYNPCRLHPSLLEWLKSLGGSVEYIVSGSSHHTNQLPQAAAAFPQAKIICSAAADAKCSAAGMRRAGFIYTNHESYETAVSELSRAGVELFHIQGDVSTQTLCVIAHSHLLDVDLSPYGNGQRHLHFDHDDWEYSSDVNVGFARLIYYGSIHESSSPGYLPDFRRMAMDSSCALTRFQIDEPSDTSCAEMAKSLRELLKKDFQFVDNVHSKKQDPLLADEFKRCLNEMWKWLDGGTLM